MTQHEAVATLPPEKLLKKFDLFVAPVDLDSLASSLNLEVSRELSWENTHSGEITVRAGLVKIWISPDEPPNRQRFTLAHEIAHYINDISPKLASNEEAPEFHDAEETLRRDGRQDPREYRANEYAARLLMPRDLILKEGREIIASEKSRNGGKRLPRNAFFSLMSKKFQVSQKAMEIRLSNLGLLPRS